MAEKNKKLTNFEQEQISTAKKIIEYKMPSEANVVSILYKNPDYLYDSTLDINDFSTNMWKVYFYIINDLVTVEKKQKIDEIVVGIYLDKHSKLKTKYDEYGGYQTILNSTKYVETENYFSYVTELKKWNAILKLCKQGFPVKDKLSEFADKTEEEIYNTYESNLNGIFINSNNDVKSYDIIDTMDDFIKTIGKDKATTFPFYNAPILNKIVGGFNIDGNIYGLGAGSGVGKSTMAFNYVVPSALEKNEKIVFIINEEDEKKFQKELLIWVANNKIAKRKEDYVHKYMIRDGDISDKTRQTLLQASEWINEYKGKQLFTVIPLEKYSAKTVIKLIKKYAVQYGVRIFVLDTLKESFDAKTDEIYKSMMRDMVDLYDVVKPSAKNVGLFVTYQLGKSSLKMRHLTNNEIGQAKSILDVMSVNLMMRRPYEDEYDKLQYYTKEGMFGGTHLNYPLKKENKPMIVFVTKNRFGVTDEEQIVTECDFSTNICKDVGYCVVPQDW